MNKMLTIDIPVGHGVAANGVKAEFDESVDAFVPGRSFVRIGTTEGDSKDAKVWDVDWLCEIIINSQKQAQDYADIFQEVADKMREIEEGEKSL